MRKNGYRGEARGTGAGQRLCLALLPSGKRCVKDRNHEGKCSE